jgi:UDP-N-acetylmuramate dehydrogenase
MEYFKNHSLHRLNTFHVDARARHFYKFDAIEELKEWVPRKTLDSNKVLVMGGGSNLLFTKYFDGTILTPVFKGKKIIGKDKDDVFVYFAAGEEWDECVEWAVKQELGGIENLSYIPGNAGAAPVQNIGAYGVELADVVEYVEGIYLDDGREFRMKRSEIKYDYRYSIFKGPLRNKAVITGMVLRLTRQPVFKLEYGSVRQLVMELGEVNLGNIRQAIIDIRQNKLPETGKKGNAGSFFKNPVVNREVYEQIKHNFPEIPGYILDEGAKVKIPAGWLIEQVGWKGKTKGNAGVHDKQALVLINTGGASGLEIADLAYTIQDDVQKKFGLHLEPEVNIL